MSAGEFMLRKTLSKINQMDSNLKYFLVAVLFLGINNGILSTTFNNYIEDIFSLTPEKRGFLEIPRELPGFILVIVTGMIASFSMRFWAVAVGLLSAMGVLGLAFLSPVVSVMLIWMVMWSMADHLFMPVENTMGLHLAKDGKHGKRLGQLSGIRNLAMIFGSFIVWIIASSNRSAEPGMLYKWFYVIAAVAAVISSFFFYKVRLDHERHEEKKRFVFNKKYTLYYILNMIFGARKQIFLTFAPLLLIKYYGAKPETMAILILIASALGFVFRQYFGLITDKFGEKKMFVGDALILLIICLGFAWIKNVYFLYALYIMDNLMFSTKIARTTYLNKIALKKADIAPTISLGISLDHAVSMTIPAVGGIIWGIFGYSNLFLFAAVLAVFSLVAALFVKTDKQLSSSR